HRPFSKNTHYVYNNTAHTLNPLSEREREREREDCRKMTLVKWGGLQTEVRKSMQCKLFRDKDTHTHRHTYITVFLDCLHTFFESMPRFLKTLNTNPKTTHTKCKTLYISCKRQLCFQNSIMSPQKGTLFSNDKHSPLYE